MNIPSKIAWPRKLRETVHPFMNSALWSEVDFRGDDIVIATYSKCGTTLVQQIVAQLVFDGDPEVFGMAVSPWIEAAPDALQMARTQTHRRFLKTHLPVEELIYSPQAKYISVGRDARDIVWSLHNHFMGFRKDAFPNRNDSPPMTVPPDVRQFYHDFLDGRVQHQLPFWSYIKGWWDGRTLPNLLTLHYADLIADLPGHIRKIAAFLEIPLDETKLPILVSHCSIAHMRKVAAGDANLNRFFERGAETFINKGTNGRWRDVLTQVEIDRCDQIAARELTPDCAAWLRDGGSI
jgi:aryl sulfotransferase